LNSAARLLKPGGRLVYATCSLMPAENEVVADAFTAEHPDFVQLDARQVLEQGGVTQAESLVTPAGHLRLWPHRHHTDGFFAVAWEKKA
jgi:16S rRNA (cytosine967-C5)-methyltransferase